MQLASLQHCSSSLRDMHSGIQRQLGRAKRHLGSSDTAQLSSRESAAASSFCTAAAASAAMAKRQQREYDHADTAPDVMAGKEECPAPPKTASASTDGDANCLWNLEQKGLGGSGQARDSPNKAPNYDALGGRLTQLLQPHFS